MQLSLPSMQVLGKSRARGKMAVQNGLGAPPQTHLPAFLPLPLRTFMVQSKPFFLPSYASGARLPHQLPFWDGTTGVLHWGMTVGNLQVSEGRQQEQTLYLFLVQPSFSPPSNTHSALSRYIESAASVSPPAGQVSWGLLRIFSRTGGI